MIVALAALVLVLVRTTIVCSNKHLIWIRTTITVIVVVVVTITVATINTNISNYGSSNDSSIQTFFLGKLLFIVVIAALVLVLMKTMVLIAIIVIVTTAVIVSAVARVLTGQDRQSAKRPSDGKDE